MAFDAARPRYTLPFAGTEYELLGTMALIEAVEYALGRGVGQIAVDVMEAMPSWELAKLIAVLICASDQKLSVADAKDALWNKVGLTGNPNWLLRVHLYSFLAICLAPPEMREAKAKEAGEQIGRLSAASLGESTNNSASAS